MTLIRTEDVEKYAELACESKLKAGEIKQLEEMMKNPDIIEVVNFAFADNKASAEARCCYGPRIEVYDKQDRLKCVAFFAQFLREQLVAINKQKAALEVSLQMSNVSTRGRGA